jgi:hypothetical protein
MLFKEYRKLTTRTLPDLGSLVLNSVHMSMGFCSETYELVEAVHKEDRVNAGEEIGDKLWYLANYINVNTLDIELEFNTSPITVSHSGITEDDGTNFFIIESELLDFDKKFLAYGRERDKCSMTTLVYKLFTAYNNLLINFDLDPSQVMSKNIAKLYVRFSNKFTEEDANNRDLQAELEVLSK